MCPCRLSNLSTKLSWLLSIGGTGWTPLHTSLSFHTLHKVNLMLGKELCGLTTLNPPPLCGHHHIKVELKSWKAHVRTHWKLRHEMSELCAHLRAQVLMVSCTPQWLKFLDRTRSPSVAVAWRCSTHHHFAITFYVITELNSWRLPFHVLIWNRGFVRFFLPPDPPFCFFVWLRPIQ